MLIDKDLRLSISGCFWLFYASKYISQNETKLSDLVLANVEAFAWGGETSGSYYLHPCPTHAGAECSSKKYDEGNRCAKLTYC